MTPEEETMTRDEIMQMTEEQLRLEIAKRKNMMRINSIIGNRADNGDIWVIQFFDPEFPSCQAFRQIETPPNWPLDIAAAWDLVEEMQPHFFQVYVMCWDHTTKWVCQCDPRHGHDEIVYSPTGEGDTAPLAICRAWLLWKQEEK